MAGHPGSHACRDPALSECLVGVRGPGVRPGPGTQRSRGRNCPRGADLRGKEAKLTDEDPPVHERRIEK